MVMSSSSGISLDKVKRELSLLKVIVDRLFLKSNLAGEPLIKISLETVFSESINKSWLSIYVVYEIILLCSFL